jgi:L-lysine 2,3-aminomutase
MSYGLSNQQLEEIIEFIAAYPQVEEAILFGSRALAHKNPPPMWISRSRATA